MYIKETFIFANIAERGGMRQHFDYSKLRGRMREKCGTAEKFAQTAGFTIDALTAKINGASDFTQSEIDKIRAVLNIRDDEITAFFFTKK